MEILSTRVPRLELGDDLFIIFVFSFTFRLLGPKSEFYVFQYLHLCELDRYIYMNNTIRRVEVSLLLVFA